MQKVKQCSVIVRKREVGRGGEGEGGGGDGREGGREGGGGEGCGQEGYMVNQRRVCLL